MDSVKRELAALLEHLPEGCSFEDVQYHLYVMQRFARDSIARMPKAPWHRKT